MRTVGYHNNVTVPLPLDQAWARLADFTRWREWNPFVVRVHGVRRPKLGARVELDMRWIDGSTTRTRERIVALVEADDRRGFRWDYRSPLHYAGLLRVSRWIGLERLSDGSCRYVYDEQLVGPLVCLLPMAEIRDGFDRMAAGFATACRGDRA